MEPLDSFCHAFRTMLIEESFDASLIQDRRVYESLGLEAQIFICVEETYEWRTPLLYLHKTFLFGMLCLSQRSCVILNIQNTTTLIVISEYTEAVSV